MGRQVVKSCLVLLALAGFTTALNVVNTDSAAAAACLTTRNIAHARAVADMDDCTNIAPADHLARLQSYLATNSATYITWVSPVNNSAGNTLIVDAGSSSVQLQLNSLTYRKQLHGSGNDRLAIYNNYIASPSTPPGLVGVTWVHTYPASGQNLRYRINDPLTFTMPLNPLIYDDRVLTVNPEYKGVQTTVNGQYWCVMSPTTTGSIQVYGLSQAEWSKCPVNGSGMAITLLIRSNWTTAAESMLYVREPSDATFTARTGWIPAGAARTTTSIPAGSEVYWQYRIRLNSASKDQNFSISSQTQRSVAAGVAPALDTSLIAPFSGSPITVNSTTSTIANTYLSPQIRSQQFTLTGAMAGSVICERVSWTPASSISGAAPAGNGQSTDNNCVQASYSPDLVPTTNGSVNVITPGETGVPVTSSIDSTGSTHNGEDTLAGVARFVVKNGNSLDRTTPDTATTDTSSGFTCRIVNGTVAPAASQCDSEQEITITAGEAAWPQSVWNGSWDISDLNLGVGDQVCFITVVNKYNASAADTDWRHSAPFCIVVAKVPLAQVSGGDLIARGGSGSPSIFGATFLTDGRLYGSWVEYGAFGTSEVNIHSAGSIARNSDTAIAGADKNDLVFANTGAGAPGGFVDATVVSMPDWSTMGLTEYTVAPNFTTPGYYKLTSNITLSGATISSGTYIIETTGDVTIDGNLKYNNPSGSGLADLPQIIINAGNIYINEGVTEIDAWLIASATINTCGNTSDPSPYYSGLSSSACTAKLRVNGITKAGKLVLRRTAGDDGAGATDDARREPAEVFNARSDAYLWMHGRSTDRSAVRITAVRELPPRF